MRKPNFSAASLENIVHAALARGFSRAILAAQRQASKPSFDGAEFAQTECSGCFHPDPARWIMTNSTLQNCSTLAQHLVLAAATAGVESSWYPVLAPRRLGSRHFSAADQPLPGSFAGLGNARGRCGSKILTRGKGRLI